jgi:hypothetical protein
MRKIFTSIIIFLLFSVFSAKAQTTAMDFTRDDCFGVHHNHFSELDSGKVIVLDFIMPGCTSCLVASDTVRNLIKPLEISNPGRVKLYSFGYIKNYNCEQLLSWNSSHNIGAANGFKVYPSFFKGDVNVKSTKPYNGKFVIYDVTGKEVIREEIRGTSEVTVNTQSLPKGLYCATIMDQSGMMGSVKLIKQ